LLAKARRGQLRVALPVGLVYDELDQVVLHPDIQVRESIQLFFRTFFRTSTACATVKYFTEHNILFPAPATVGRHSSAVIWGRLTLARAVGLLHNPRYAGAFTYGRRHTRKQIDGHSHTTRLPRDQWQVLLLDAHPGYISWNDYERIQQQLRASAVAYGHDRRHGPPREGPALLQGLAICGRCGTRMTVRYHRRDGQLVPDYGCHVRTMQYRVPTCQKIPGGDVDAAIGRLLVDGWKGDAFAFELNLYEAYNGSSAPFNLAGLARRDVERSSALEWSQVDQDKTEALMAIDRLNARLSSGRVDFTIGRQAINLATTYLFSPNDFFAPFTAQTFYRVYKSGVDSARMEVRLGELSQLTLVGALGFGQDREPALHCDAAGCGTILHVRPVRGGPPKWLLDRTAPKGWHTRIESGRRFDLCPRCRAALKGTP